MPAKHSACNKAFSDGGLFFLQKTEWKETKGSYLAKEPLNKLKNKHLILPSKYVTPKISKVSHWLRQSETVIFVGGSGNKKTSWAKSSHHESLVTLFLAGKK